MDIFIQVKAHWQQLREGTYQFLDGLKDSDLDLKLPFAKSQTIRYQLHCMGGAQESNLSLITTGKWLGYSSSLDKLGKTDLATIKNHLHVADKKMLIAFKNLDWNKKFTDGNTPLINYLILVEHESHHYGQLINFIYAHNLSIPQSWQSKWALAN